VSLPPREPVVSSYLDDDLLEELPVRPSTRQLPRARRQSMEAFSSTQTAPRARRQSMEAVPSTQPAPRARRQSMEADSLGPRRSSSPLSPRPNPRRTHQLLRQQILSAKKAGTSEDTEQLDPDINTDYDLVDEDPAPYDDDMTLRPVRRRSGTIQPYPYPV